MTKRKQSNLNQMLSAEPISVLPPNFQLLRAHTGWQHRWSHIALGEFSATSLFSSLFFYSQSDGVGEFYETDGSGGITLLQSHILSNSVTHIVPGIFCKPGIFSALFAYDQQARVGTFYDTKGQGNLVQLSEYNDDRHAWTHIVAGHLTNSKFSDLVFYDQANGFGALYSTNGSGGMSLVAEYSDWRRSWTHILVRRFRGKGGDQVIGRHDIFFYESPQPGYPAYSEIYEVYGQGGISQIRSQNLNLSADIIIPGSFGNGYSGIFMYDRNAGSGTVVDVVELDPNDDLGPDNPDHYTEYNKVSMKESESYTGLQTTWNIIVPGNFWVVDEGDHHFQESAFTDFFFYDRDRGFGEFYLYEAPESTGVRPLAGYASAGSVRPGERINFFVSSQIGTYTIKVYRQSDDEIFLIDIQDLPTAPTPLTINRTAWRDGAQWPAVGGVTIPSDWPSGLYLARVESMRNGIALDIPFIVRAAIDGNQSKILMVMNDTTYEAYNFWGGRSLYGFGLHNTGYFTIPGAETLPRAFRVSFRRPTWDGIGSEHDHKWVFWEVPMIRWLARQGIRVEWCTLVDLHKDSQLLCNYELFVTVGHSEYWSKEMRENVVGFVNSGGNAAFFTGNTCWWRVRIEDDGNTMVCYKEESFDPTDDPTTLTGNWSPELATGLTGVAFNNGLVWDFKDDPDGTADEKKDKFQYIVQDSNHWVFANTGLHKTDLFGVYYDTDGKKQTVVGGETDRLQKSSPSSFHKLAFIRFKNSSDVKVEREVATMGIFTRGGTVFTASTMYWTRGLGQNEIVDRITRNVFDRLGNLRIHVRESLDLVGKAASIKQLAHQNNESFPLSLREFVEKHGKST